jgi:hypothetical protein
MKGTIKKLVSAPYKLALRGMPDRVALSIEYYRRLGRFPNLSSPVLFTEKCQVRKMNDRDQRHLVLVDKVNVKDFVAARLGHEWLIPTLWSGPALPPRSERNWPVPFVMKTNHTSGGNIFVRSPADLDWDAIELRISEWMARPYEPHTRQWAYNSIERKIIVEPFIGEAGTLPTDYKLFVFRGRVEFIEVDTDRERAHKRSFYNRDWERQPFGLQYPLDPREAPKPSCLSEMIRGAEILAEDAPFIRVDLYDVGGRPLFGEMTLFPDGGMGKFTPPEMDRVFGDLMG